MPYFMEWFVGFQLLQELLWFALLLIVVVTVTSVRNEPDPGGRRLVACFLAAVMALSLLVGVLASAMAVGELASVVKDDDGSQFEIEYGDDFDPGEFGGEDDEPGHEDDYAGALQAGLFAVAAGAVFVYHRRKLDDLLADADVRAGAAGRIAEGYGYVATVLGLAALAGGAAAAVFGLVKLAAPDVFSTDDAEVARQAAAGTLLVGAWVAAVGYGIVTLHRQDEGDDAPEEAPGPPVEELPGPPEEEAPIP